MNIADALRNALGHVDASDWRGALDAIHAEEGSWRATASVLGVDRRTVERWRYGYYDKRTQTRRQISPDTVRRRVVPAVSKALAANRRAQVARVDWRKLQLAGNLQIANYPPRREWMNVGLYLSPDAIAGISAAYVSGDSGRIERAFNDALSNDYTGTGDASIGDVTQLDFG